MPNDSPCSEGAHSTSAPASRDATSSSLSTPSQCTRSDAGCRRRCTSVGRAVAGHPQDGGPLHRGEGVEEHLQALARLVATEEQHGRPALRVPMRRGQLEAIHVDAVEQHLEVAPARAQARLACRLRHGDADLHAAPHQLRQRAQRADPSADPGPVVGADHRERRREHEAVGGHRRQRLVQVHHVEAAVGARSARPAPPPSATARPGPPTRWSAAPTGRPKMKCSPDRPRAPRRRVVPARAR